MSIRRKLEPAGYHNAFIAWWYSLPPRPVDRFDIIPACDGQTDGLTDTGKLQKSLMQTAFCKQKGIPVRVSNTSTETACLKWIFKKFASSCLDALINSINSHFVINSLHKLLRPLYFAHLRAGIRRTRAYRQKKHRLRISYLSRTCR